MYRWNTYIVVGLVSIVLLLSGCSKDSTEIGEETARQPFLINTSTIKELSTSNSIRKSGVIVGAQSVTVSSQVNGRVADILHQAGEVINDGTTVISLKDSSGQYSFNAQRAKAQLESARINYESTQNSLEKSLQDSSLSIKQAKNQYDAANTDGAGSAAIQLQQLEQQAQKAELDYQTQLDANVQTIDNFAGTIANIGKDIELLYESITETVDSILGVTALFEKENDAYEQYLGVKNTDSLRQAKRELTQILSKKKQYQDLGKEVSVESFTTRLQEYQSLLAGLEGVLEKTDTVLEYSITGTQFPQSQLDALTTTINNLKTQVQGKKSSITQQVNTIKSFLATYQQQEESLRQQVEITKQQIATTKSNIKNSESSADLGLEGAKNTYDAALKNKKTTLASLSNSIEQARIAYNEAQNQLSKFAIRAPIQGTIGEILVDVGEEVSPGTALFTISSSNEQQVKIALTAQDTKSVKVGQAVTLIQDDQTYSGTIQSISNVADKNFTYTAIVNITQPINLLGDVIDVEIATRSPHPLLPINIVNILGRNEGLINVLENDTVVPTKVELGKIRGEYIEVISNLPDDIDIITSDISNFNETKQVLRVQ